MRPLFEGFLTPFSHLFDLRVLGDVVADLHQAVVIDLVLLALQEMAETSLHDGCTKTNPVIPTVPEFADLLKKAYYGA